MRYLANCPAGFQDVAAASLRLDLGDDLRVARTEDGFIVFDSGASPRCVAARPYLNNAFISLWQELADGQRTIDDFVAGVIKAVPASRLRRAAPRRARTFRLMVSDAGRLVAVGRRIRSALVDVLSNTTGLRYSSGRADCEFWVVRRRSGIGFLCVRIGIRGRTERDLQRGELRPELAHLLCALSEPRSSDVCLDPFAGTGAIPFARATLPYSMIFAFDYDEQRVRKLKLHLKTAVAPGGGRYSRLIVRREDARALQSINDGFVDKIVTDPPWGIFDDEGSYSSAFYTAVTREFVRVTKRGGIVVLLLGNEHEAHRLRQEFGADLECLSFLNVLVAGRKACVVKWRRRESNGHTVTSPDEGPRC